MKQRLLPGIALMLALVAASDTTARTAARPSVMADPARAALIDRTDAALLDQIRCRRTPQAARAINAMLKNRLVRYVGDEDGVYLFAPTAPLTFLGLRVIYIGGFDDAAFEGVPASAMAGTAPPVFFEIDVAAPASELRKRALQAGLIEAIPYKDTRRGFQVSAEGWFSYPAGKRRAGTSSIMCAD